MPFTSLLLQSLQNLLSLPWNLLALPPTPSLLPLSESSLLERKTNIQLSLPLLVPLRPVLTGASAHTPSTLPVLPTRHQTNENALWSTLPLSPSSLIVEPRFTLVIMMVTSSVFGPFPPFS
ncbi:hypothetical protein BDR03DRAFT_1018527 [Suillus americanus]|nr:hypothetical protein BDR03DRAFT_1018527 [Suillus americanus]